MLHRFSFLRPSSGALVSRGNIVARPPPALSCVPAVEKPSFRSLSYEQGQYDNNTREYFYYIDHQGMLFLDDAKMKNFTSCFKETTFLRFFFKRLKRNDTGNYPTDFPFLSPCGGESNYVRCEDCPIVFTKVFDSDSTSPLLSYNWGDRLLTRPFQPSQICMVPETGRVYHPALEKVGGVGLISDKLSILWTQEKRFIFEKGEENPPSKFVWNDEEITLTNELAEKVKML